MMRGRMDETDSREERKKFFFVRERNAKVRTTHQDTDTDASVHKRKPACDSILRCIVKRHSQRAYQDGHIEIGDPG
jgi:hypothetical protein